MTSWLAAQLLPFSVLLGLLLLTHKMALSALGAITKYYLWALVPLTLMLSFVSTTSETAINSGEIFHMVANLQTNVKAIAATDWINITWVSGVIISALFFALNLYKVSLEHDYSPIAPETVSVDLPKRLSLGQSKLIDSPLISGLFSPCLVVPEHFFKQYSKQEQQLILEHEVCHFVRHDLVANFIAVIILILFWFNPLAWIAYFRFRKDQELACDAQVLATKNKQTKLLYSRALLKCAQNNRQFTFAQLQYGDKETMTERILQIKARRSGSTLMSAIALSLGLLASISISYAGNNHQVVKAGHKAPTPSMRIAPVYPVDAAKNNISGYVVLKFNITPAGIVDDVTIVKSQPEGAFDEEAKTALTQWRYHSSEYGEQNALVQLDFVLDQPIAGIERIKVEKS